MIKPSENEIVSCNGEIKVDMAESVRLYEKSNVFLHAVQIADLHNSWKFREQKEGLLLRGY